MTITFATTLLLAVITLVACGVMKRNMNLNRQTPDYTNRIIDFWNGNVPNKITDEFKSTDLNFARYLFSSDRENQVPYMLNYAMENSPTPTPAMVICPGGSYAFRSEKIEGTEIAEWLNSIGIAAFVLNYRVEPYKHPIPLMDAKQAVKFLRTNAGKYNINSNKIGVIGFSAGGHLASLLAAHGDGVENDTSTNITKQSSRPDVVILCYSVITMVGEHAHEGVKKKLLPQNPSDSLLSYLSTQNQVTHQTPPTFIWTTKNDNMVDYQNSEMYVEALKKNGVKYEYHLFPKGHHGQGLARGKDIGEWTQLCESWLKKINFLTK